MEDDDILICKTALYVIKVCVTWFLLIAEQQNDNNRLGGFAKPIARSRRSIHSICKEYGNLFDRAFRMSWSAFNHLHSLLKDSLASEHQRQYGHINGPIASQERLAMALRYFAGASPYDIMIVFGVGLTDVYKSVWIVVDACNNHLSNMYPLSYPEDHEEQQDIARGFTGRSAVGFNNCAGAIDGVMICIEKPSELQCERSNVGSGRFYCGRKGKYGLNMQAVCDSRRRFLDISIRHPASASDFLAFVTSNLYESLTNQNVLAPGLALYGDNAYVNTSYMAVPFLKVGSGVKDDYNFFHSQVRAMNNKWRAASFFKQSY
jgi:hypothetical protein